MEYLDACAAAVCYGNAAVGTDGNALWMDKLPIAAPGRPESESERAVGVEDLYAVIYTVCNAVRVSIDHGNAAVGTDGDAQREIELSVIVAT